MKGRRVEARDVLELLSLGSIAAGLWWLSPPWACIIVGTLLLALSLISRLRPGRQDSSREPS